MSARRRLAGSPNCARHIACPAPSRSSPEARLGWRDAGSLSRFPGFTSTGRSRGQSALIATLTAMCAIRGRSAALRYAPSPSKMASMRAHRPLRSDDRSSSAASLMEPATVWMRCGEVAHQLDGSGIEGNAGGQSVPSVEADVFATIAPPASTASRWAIRALNDADLRFLGRLHDVSEALHAIQAGARDLSAPSLVLICAARPDAGRRGRRKLDEAIGHAADHLSFISSPSRKVPPSTSSIRPTNSDTGADLAADLYHQLRRNHRRAWPAGL